MGPLPFMADIHGLQNGGDPSRLLSGKILKSVNGEW